jgi:hypothetical protein
MPRNLFSWRALASMPSLPQSAEQNSPQKIVRSRSHKCRRGLPSDRHRNKGKDYAMKSKMMFACVIASLVVPLAARAQGIPDGIQHGASVGSQTAGPVGAVVGGAVGGVIGGVEGLFGFGPTYVAYPQPAPAPVVYPHHHRLRHLHQHVS